MKGLTNSLFIKVHNSVKEAPHWNHDHPDVRSGNLKEAHIVLKGTKSGRPTVDLLFEDEHGDRFVTIATGLVIENLAAVLKGAME